MSIDPRQARRRDTPLAVVGLVLTVVLLSAARASAHAAPRPDPAPAPAPAGSVAPDPAPGSGGASGRSSPTVGATVAGSSTGASRAPTNPVAPSVIAAPTEAPPATVHRAAFHPPRRRAGAGERSRRPPRPGRARRPSRRGGRRSGVADATEGPVTPPAATAATPARSRHDHTLLIVGAILELIVLAVALGLRRTLRGVLGPGPELPA